jgi:GTP-binding protein EngB required for normal cell division
MSTSPFAASQAHHLLQSLLSLHRQLVELEFLSSQVSRSSPFSQYVHDLSPTEVRVLLDHFARIRAAMLSHLEELAVQVEVRKSSVRWALQTSLMHIQVAIDDMGPERLKSYGLLSDASRAAAIRIQDDLTRLLDRTRAYLTQGLRRDLSERLARLATTPVSVGLLSSLERIITRWQLVEYRPVIEMIVSRLESPSYEVAVFGRVSTGKSSLLNHVVGTNVLPVGVTPVTSVPTRLEFGQRSAVQISFAESQSCTIGAERLWEYASEEGNPGNAKRVTGIHVTVPSPRLRSGVVFVDTPGVGSLAALGAAETLAYLPRCDLGIVLIDASSSVAPDDLALLRALYEAGTPAMVILSKADLLSLHDRKRMVGYIHAQVERELRLDLPVHPVSVVGADESLLLRWFADELEPIMSRHHELVAASIRRKISSVRESVAVSLETLLSRRTGGLQSARSDASEIRRRLELADSLIRKTRERWRDWPTESQIVMEEILQLAAQAMIKHRRRLPGASDEFLSATASEILGQRAQSAHDVVACLRDELSKVLGRSDESAAEVDAPAASVRGMKFDALPFPVLEGLRTEQQIRCPWWTRYLPSFAKSELEKRIWQHYGQAIRDVVGTYDRQLLAWVKRMTDGVVEQFELQASLFREQVRRLASGPVDGQLASGEVDALEADLRSLRREPVKDLASDGLPSVPVAGELQPQ